MSDQKYKVDKSAWIFLAVISILLFAAVYFLAVLTVPGQRFENAALDGQRLQNALTLQDADETLAAISRISLILSIVVIFTIGLMRRNIRLAIAGAGTIIVSTGITEVLKLFVLPRPDLVGAPADILNNSFPSGHTTIAMSILVATLIVIPYRGRGWAMLFVFTWAVGIGAATIAAHWHRLSDTLGADLVAIAVGALFSLWLTSSGEVRPVRTKRYVVHTVLVIFWTLFAIGALIVGAIFIVNLYRLTGTDYQEACYHLTHTLASGGSVLAGLAFWFSWHRLEVPARPRNYS
jgi:PAP2 superfamily.